MIDELFEYGVYLALLVALAIPLSAYLNKVMAGQKTVLSGCWFRWRTRSTAASA